MADDQQPPVPADVLSEKLEQANRQLVQSEKMAAIGQLAAGVAHEINNPVGYVYSNLQSLQTYLADLFRLTDAVETAQSVDDLRQIRKSIDYDYLRSDLDDLIKESREGIERVKVIIAAMKDFSHIEEEEFRPADIHSGFDTTLNVVNNELKYKAEVIRDYGDLPEVECILSQINQVIMNLLVNAAHAMESAGTITLRTRQEDDSVVIQVSDTGKGIEQAHLNRIFEPFFTTKQPGRGTGLGLSMVYGFLKQSGGHINLYSEPGEGTSVKLYLPRSTDEPAPTETTDVTAPSVGHEVVLVVEDDNLVRGYVTGQLRAAGYQVVEARNGPEALALLSARPDVELLFTDVMMPGGMTGRELADAAVKQKPGLPVLYTSGYTENAIVHNGRLDPGVQLLGKPYRKADLLRKIREVLDEQH